MVNESAVHLVIGRPSGHIDRRTTHDDAALSRVLPTEGLEQHTHCQHSRIGNIAYVAAYRVRRLRVCHKEII